MAILSRVQSALQEELGNYLDDLARESGLVIRQRKLTGQTLLRILVLTLLQKPQARPCDFHGTAAALGIDVSQTALDKRWDAGQPLVTFLHKALEHALRQVISAQPDATGLLESFTAVLVGDSSVITLHAELSGFYRGCGGSQEASTAAVKLHVLWDLKTGSLRQLQLSDGKDSDVKNAIAQSPVRPGTLLLFDLGYFDLQRFSSIGEQQAFYVSRLQHGTGVYSCKEEAMDLLQYLRSQQQGLIDQVVLLGATLQLCSRLIAWRLPQEIADRRRHKAREKARNSGREASEHYLELLGWSLFVTNTSQEQLGYKAVMVLYRARWQIELLFKLWKSHNALKHHHSGHPPLQQLAWFYARLIGVLLQHWLLLGMVWQMHRRSLFKAAQQLRDSMKTIILTLNDTEKLTWALQQIQKAIEPLAQTKARKNQPSHAQLIEDEQWLEWDA